MFMRLFRDLRIALSWRTVKVRPGWMYQQNKVTGQRRAIVMYNAGYSPLDTDWVFGHSGSDLWNFDFWTPEVLGPMPQETDDDN